MTIEKIERLEKVVMSLVVQALTDYKSEIVTIFAEETDQPQDIAEDVTREAIEKMGVSSIQDRLYGKVDVKKAIYVFLPEPVPVALMLDAKAEKRNGDRTATIQMSQTSMRVRLNRQGVALDEQGKLDQVIHRESRSYHVVTVIAKYVYEDLNPGQRLLRIIVSCIPNGKLQDNYNPSADDTIWLVGRDAPTLGEDFRVRLNYRRLSEQAEWRVQEVSLQDVSYSGGVDVKRSNG